MTTTKYPRYHLSYETNKATTYHKKHKKTILPDLELSRKARGLKKTMS